MRGNLHIQLLGEVEARLDGRLLPSGPRLQRTLLAALAVDVGRTVSISELLDRLWSGEPPRTAGKSIQKYVWRLRSDLGPEAIARSNGGYRLDVPASCVDAHRFELALNQARAELDPARRSQRIEATLEAFTGQPLEGIDGVFAEQERARLEDLRLSALEDRLTTDLELGRTAEVVQVVSGLVSRHPYREGLWRSLMLGLYQTGRQTDALRTFAALRRRLSGDLGIEPGPELRRLEAQILAHDPSLLPRGPRADPSTTADAPFDEHRLVAALVVGSDRWASALDEVAHRFDGRILYDADPPAVLFGIPAREDDLLRATQAALELHDRGVDRIVVTSGEALVRDHAGTIRAWGGGLDHAVALLGRHAISGPVIDRATARGLGDAAATRVGPDGEIILLALHPDAAASRPVDGPFVGRSSELSQLRARWNECLAGHSGHLVSLVGEGGVGKTRMLAELRRSIEHDGTTWLQVACQPGSEGGLSPLIQLHRRALGPDPIDAVDRLGAGAGLSDAESNWLRNHLSVLLQDTSAPQSSHAESLRAWARLLELGVMPDGAVIVIDDAHWAPPVVWEFFAELVSEASVPLLVLVAVRPDHVDPPINAASQVPRSTIPVTRLDDATCRQLAGVLVGEAPTSALATDLSERSGGNPFFLHELARRVRETGQLDRAPENVRQALAARIDRAGNAARLVLQVISVLGGPARLDMLAHVAELPESFVGDALAELRRRQLTASAHGRPSEHAVSHPLVAEVAARQVPSTRCLAIHDRAAEWLQSTPDAHLLEILEQTVFHATKASQLAGELSSPDRERLAQRSARVTLALGRRLEPLESRKSHEMLTAALAGLDPSSVEWARAAVIAGRVAGDLSQLDDAERYLTDAIRVLSQLGNRRSESIARVGLGHVRRLRGDDGVGDEIERAVALVERDPGSELALAVSWQTAHLAVIGRAAEALEVVDRWRAVVDDFAAPEMWARFHHAEALARIELGEVDGLVDLRRLLERCLDQGLTRQATSVFNNLGNNTWFYDGPRDAIPILERALEFAARRSYEFVHAFTTNTLLEVLYDAGEWDRSLEVAERLSHERDHRLATVDSPELIAGQIHLWRGDRSRARSLLTLANADEARAIGDLQYVAPWLVGAAMGRFDDGDHGTALDLIDEMREITSDNPRWRCSELQNAVRILVALDEIDLAERLVPAEPLRMTRSELVRRTSAALVSGARGDSHHAAASFRALADDWERFGNPLEASLALRGHARAVRLLGDEDLARSCDERARRGLVDLGITSEWHAPEIGR
ncbi:MAG: BTAD domain-containing putative transcriptional regulator [Actinomycetota bacterium]